MELLAELVKTEAELLAAKNRSSAQAAATPATTPCGSVPRAGNHQKVEPVLHMDPIPTAIYPLPDPEMGTSAYIAPEQASGNAKFVGPQADVWARGVILYESLTGTRPFDADEGGASHPACVVSWLAFPSAFRRAYSIAMR